MKEIPVTFKSKGQQIVGMLHSPNRKKSPAIILCHGFSGSKTTPRGYLFPRISRELCKKGFIVLRFDFRGCGDSEGKSEDYSYKTQLEDLGTGLDFLEKNPKVDKNRIGVLGHSVAGATVVIKAKEDERIKCLVCLASNVFLKERLSDDEIKNIKRNGFFYNEERGLKVGIKFWKDIERIDNTINYVTEINVPILIVHGNADEVIPYSESKELYKNANEPKKLDIIKEANHSFTVENHRKKVINSTIEWFNKWLK